MRPGFVMYDSFDEVLSCFEFHVITYDVVMLRERFLPFILLAYLCLAVCSSLHVRPCLELNRAC